MATGRFGRSAMFLISLAICLVAFYVMTRSSDEICYLSGTISLVSLLVTVVIAPWEAQVLLLVGSGLAIKHISSPPPKPLESQQGVAADSHPPQELHKDLSLGNNSSPAFKYRGAAYEPQADPASMSQQKQLISSEQETPLQPAACELKFYRGVAYGLNTGSESVHLVPAPNSKLKYRGCPISSPDSQESP